MRARRGQHCITQKAAAKAAPSQLGIARLSYHNLWLRHVTGLCYADQASAFARGEARLHALRASPQADRRGG